MMLLFMTAVLGAFMVGVAWFAARKRATRLDQETADDIAIRDLYDHYLTGIDALTQAHLLQGPSDEEWLEGIRTQASASGQSQQTGPSLARGPLPSRIPGLRSAGCRAVPYAWLPLLASIVGPVVVTVMLAGSLIRAYIIVMVTLAGALVGYIVVISLAIHREAVSREIRPEEDSRAAPGARMANRVHAGYPAVLDQATGWRDRPR